MASSDRPLAAEPTDDILWSDCTEEMYLRRILDEQRGDDDGTFVDSLMGQSTVAEIFAKRDENDRDQIDVVGDDDRGWTRFAPIARSVATTMDGRTTSESSLPSITDYPSIQATLVDQNESMDVESYYNMEMKEGSVLYPGGNFPKYVNSDDEDDSTVRLPQMMNDEETAEDEEFNKEALGADHSQAGISTLTGDSLLRYGQVANIFEYEHPRWWLNLEDAKRKKIREAEQGLEPTDPKDLRLDLTRSFSQSGQDTTPSSPDDENFKEASCCSRFLHLITGNDTVFRRIVIISLLFIFIFVALAIFAIIQADGVPFGGNASNEDDGSDAFSIQRPSPPIEAPDNEGTFDSPVAPPMASPTEALQPISTSAPTQSSSPVASDATNSPTGDDGQEGIVNYARYVTEIIRSRSPTALRALTSEGSPQNQALDWIANELKGSGSIPADDIILQRWIMAVLFYALGGANWENNQGWLSNDALCSWFSTSEEPVCNEQGMLERLELEDNGLQGSLPFEIGLFSDSIVILNLSQNQLSGTIPDSIRRLSSLASLHLESNFLTGTITPSVCEGQMDALDSAWVDCDRLECSCCVAC